MISLKIKNVAQKLYFRWQLKINGGKYTGACNGDSGGPNNYYDREKNK